MDAPPSVEGGKKISASYAAGMIHKVASVYGWEDDKILDTPLAALFQLLNWIAVDEHYNTPQFNLLQDRIKARMM